MSIIPHPIKTLSDLIQAAIPIKNVSAVAVMTLEGWYEIDIEAVRSRQEQANQEESEHG